MRATGPEPTILMAEDEPAAADVLRQILEEFGYRVIYTTNGLDALILYRHFGDHIDLILTDLEMPRMRGDELVSAIRAFDENVAIIVHSGRSHLELPVALRNSVHCWIRKPAPADHLASRIAQVLRQVG